MTHPQVYPPGDDTLLLVRAAASEVVEGDRVLEVGCGSARAALQVNDISRVLATDINPHAVREARAAGVDVIRADLLEGVRGPFDLILFNPPYLPTLPEERMDDWLEYALDGGRGGADVIRRFAGQAGRVLAPGGRILLVFSSLTGISVVRRILHEQGFRMEVVLQHEIEGEILYVVRCSLRSSTGTSGP